MQLIEQIIIGMICILPLLMVYVVHREFKKNTRALLNWRRSIFFAGEIVSGMSAAVIFAYVVHALLIYDGLASSVDLLRSYPVLTMIAFALVGLILALFGRGLSRILLSGNGILLLILWWQALLGTSA